MPRRLLTHSPVSTTRSRPRICSSDGGFVDAAASLSELRGGAGIARGKIQITDRSGASREVDLTRAFNVDDVLRQINSTTGIKVNAKVRRRSDRLNGSFKQYGFESHRHRGWRRAKRQPISVLTASIQLRTRRPAKISLSFQTGLDCRPSAMVEALPLFPRKT